MGSGSEKVNHFSVQSDNLNSARKSQAAPAVRRPHKRAAGEENFDAQAVILLAILPARTRASRHDQSQPWSQIAFTTEKVATPPKPRTRKSTLSAAPAAPAAKGERASRSSVDVACRQQVDARLSVCEEL